MAVTIKKAWKCRVAFNQARPGIKGLFASKLRFIADLVDGQRSLSIHITAEPELTLNQELSCIRAGTVTIEEQVKFEAKSNAEEYIFTELQKAGVGDFIK